MPRPMDVFMGFVSWHGQKCYEHNINPDVDELRRYNEVAKRRECPHESQRTISNDDAGTSYRICSICGENYKLPDPVRLDGLPFDKNRMW